MEEVLRLIDPRVPPFLVIAFMGSLAYLIQYFDKVQEVSDKLKSSTKSAYLLNKVEEFDFVIGEQRFYDIITPKT